MQRDDMISANEFCTYYNIDFSFIRSLNEYGLIKVIVIDDTGFIQTGEIDRLEKIIRLHYDLEINIEGIEAITYLLERLEYMHQEITSLKNRLGIYETV